MAIEIEIAKAIAQVENGAIFFAAATAWWWTTSRLRRHYSRKDCAYLASGACEHVMLDDRAVNAVWALWAISLAVMIRIGYWLPSIYFAAAGAHYANWAEAYKHYIYLPAAILFVSGAARLVGVLAEKPRHWCWRMYAGSILFGAALATGGVVW